MTGVEEAGLAAALAGGAGTGAAAAGTGAALGAGALGAGAAGAGAAGAGALTASEAAALGLTASQAGAASAAGLTAADLAGTGAAAGAGATGSSGLLAGGASTAVPSLSYLAPEASGAAGSSGLLSGGAADAGALNGAGYLAPEMGQASAPITDMSSQAGLFDKANYATNGKLGATKDWLAQKPLGNGSLSPTRGQMLQQGGKAMMGQQQQPQAAPAMPVNMGPGQYVPVQQSSPYAQSGPFHSTLSADGQPFMGMADYLNRRRF